MTSATALNRVSFNEYGDYLDMPIVKLACIVGFTVILAALLGIAFCLLQEVCDRLPKYVRDKFGITRALRCDKCACNIDGRCDR